MAFHRLILFMSITLIFCMGLLMIFSTTSAEVLDHDLDKSTHSAFLKQMLYASGGLVLAIGVYSLGYQRILQYSPVFLTILCVFLMLVLIPGVGREVNGSRRWIGIAGLSFQPSEFVKYILSAFFIYRYLKYKPSEFTLKEFLKLAFIAAIPLLLILVEPNNGTAAVLGIVLVVLCFLMRVCFKYWLIPLTALMLIGGISAFHLPYVSARLKVYLNPELDLKGKGHQPYQAKIATGSGRIFGKGPGNSLQKLSYLPEAQNDYIAAIYAEEFGFVGILALIGLYMLLGYAGFYIAFQAEDFGGFYFASAIAFLMTFQAFLNLGVVSGLLPSTGLNLPFFSQGGSSLMANLMGAGILWSVSKKEKLPQKTV